MFFYYYFFMSGFVSLILIRSHVLLCLLSIEYMVICLMFFFLGYCFFCSSYYFYLVFMTFCVCDGVLGLSILVNMIRFSGNDYLNSMFMW